MPDTLNQKEETMKKYIAIMLVVALTGVMAAAAYAASAFVYNGNVKAIKPATSEIVFSAVRDPERDGSRPIPKKITIKLNEKAFALIRQNHEKLSKNDPPTEVYINVKYAVEGGKNVAKSVRIIPRGC